MLGHICLQAQSDFRDTLSTLECYIIDPRRNRDQNYLVEPPHNNICCLTQEEVTIGSASEDAVTERVSNSDQNQSTGDNLEGHVSEIFPTKVSGRLKQLLRDPIEVNDLEKYTQVVKEFCDRIGWEPSYSWCDRVLFPSRLFTCTVTLAGLKAVGLECRSKKEAKHEASKVLLELLRARYQE